MRLRFSIASLLAAIVFCGISLAALRTPSALWASAVFTAVVGVLSAAILGAIASRGRSRLTRSGLALFGWIYLAIAFGPWPFNRDGPPPLLPVPLLATIQDFIVSYGDSAYFMEDRRNPQDWIADLHWSGGPVAGNVLPPPPFGGYKTISLIHYRQISHTLGAALFGLIGALLGRLVAAAERRDDGSMRQHE